MNRQKWIILLVTAGLLAGAAGLLGQMRNSPRLRPPGVKAHPLAGSDRLQVDLPEKVLDYTSEWIDTDEVTLGTLPKDTSFGQRRYTAPDGFNVLVNVVLMGTDRTSLHKPQFCLEGSGWHIDQTASKPSAIGIERPCQYSLPVVELVADRQPPVEGQPPRSVYVYWFAADNALSASVSGMERMWLTAKNVLLTGVMQRWAYISCFAGCAPGQEEATFERMKQFIAAAVPEFQLVHGTPSGDTGH